MVARLNFRFQRFEAKELVAIQLLLQAGLRVSPAKDRSINRLKTFGPFLKRAVAERCPLTAEDLERVTQEEWGNNPQSMVDNLVPSILFAASGIGSGR